MTNDTITWVIAALEVVAALGIAGFWITWFRTVHDESWLPAGYFDHEFPFVFTDSILAIMLVTAATFQVTEQPAGASLGLIAGGMLVFLGILDLAYFARTELFQREHGGIANAGVVIGVLTLAAILIVRFL